MYMYMYGTQVQQGCDNLVTILQQGCHQVVTTWFEVPYYEWLHHVVVVLIDVASLSFSCSIHAYILLCVFFVALYKSVLGL